MELQIDQHELQRLLDGRLPESERIAFLQSVDERPEQWRAVALAFIEEQVLRAELRALGSAATGADTETEARPGKARAAARRALWPWLAAAALLLAGILAGNALPLTWFQPSDDGNNPAQTEHADASADRNYYVVLPATAAESAAEADTAWDVEDVTASIFDQRSRDVFRQHGYDVNEEPVILMVQDDQGGRYLIPQRRVSLVAQADGLARQPAHKDKN